MPPHGLSDGGDAGVSSFCDTLLFKSLSFDAPHCSPSIGDASHCSAFFCGTLPFNNSHVGSTPDCECCLLDAVSCDTPHWDAPRCDAPSCNITGDDAPPCDASPCNSPPCDSCCNCPTPVDGNMFCSQGITGSESSYSSLSIRSSVS